MKILTALLLITSVAFAQTKGPSDKTAQEDRTKQAAADMPSRQEINELVGKASEKITGLQSALKSVKPLLDKSDPDVFRQDSEALESARTAIAAIQKNGPSSYVLVSLISILDDIKLDTVTAGPSLAFQAMKSDNAARAIEAVDISRFLEAGTACYDISELLLHATLRYVNAEESLLNEILDKAK
jgi:hypothetical protein